MAAPSSAQIDAAIAALFADAFTNIPSALSNLQTYAQVLLGNAPAVFDGTNWDEVNWDATGGPPSQPMPWNSTGAVFSATQQEQIKAQCRAVRSQLADAEAYLQLMESAAGV